MSATQQTIDTIRRIGGAYKYGFVTDVEAEFAPKGLSEDTIRFISAKKNEPDWLLDWRLKAFKANGIQIPYPRRDIYLAKETIEFEGKSDVPAAPGRDV